MLLKTLVVALVKKKEIYSVDVEVTYNIHGNERTIIVPQNVEACSQEEAVRIAVQRELRNERTIPKVGNPRVKEVRRIEFREGW